MHFFELPETAFRFVFRALRERGETTEIGDVAGLDDAANHKIV